MILKNGGNIEVIKMNLTKQEINDFEVGTKLISKQGEHFLKTKGNTWQKKYESNTYTDEKIYNEVEVTEVLVPNYIPYNPKYTFRRLRGEPVGTKVTFKDGHIIIKVRKDEYHAEEEGEYNENDIIKVEIPTEYKTVYEVKD